MDERRIEILSEIYTLRQELDDLSGQVHQLDSEIIRSRNS